MRFVWFLSLFMMLTATAVRAQQAALRQAESKMGAGKWSSARQLLNKALAKDSINTEAHWLLAQFFFSRANSYFNLDSAQHFALLALSDLSQSSERQKERFKKSGIDSTAILRLDTQVDSTGFAEARLQNTEAAYVQFLQRFPRTAHRQKAIDLRNEVAFLDALRQNSVAAYQSYLARYPESARAEEAIARYERLLFDEHTRSGKLAGYEKFLTLYPNTAYRDSAQQMIFQISTAEGDLTSFEKFVARHRGSRWADRAIDLAHFLAAAQGQPLPASLLADSLQSAAQRMSGYWVPFLKNDMYGFLNESGEEMMPPTFQTIDPTYLCGNLTQDFFLTSRGVVTRRGTTVYPESLDEATDLGLGFLLLRKDTCLRVVHKTGFHLTASCVEEAKTIANSFIAVRKNDLWALFALNGLQLLPYNYQNIEFIEEVLVLVKTGKKILVRAREVAQVADRVPLQESMVFDEVRPWGTDMILVKNGFLEGVVNQQLEFVIPFERQQLTKTNFGFLRQRERGITLVGATAEVEKQTFDRVKEYGQWVELTQLGATSIYDATLQRVLEKNVDSIWFQNRVLFSRKADSLLIFGRTGKLASFNRNAPVTFIKSRDSSAFFFVPDKNRKTVFETSVSRKLFTAEFDEIEYVGNGAFLFGRAKKKGLLASDGKTLLPPQYDIIVVQPNGMLSLYKDKKFGLFDLSVKKLIKTVYDRNLVPYHADQLVAYKGAGYGLITLDDVALTPFEFDEIRYWNDTSALVRKNHAWSVYSLSSGKTVLDRIRHFETIAASAHETILKIHRDNYVGIVSNRHGLIIPPNFTEIINLGSDERPLYFTEKHVEEADLFVVIYYDSRGKLLRKQVYEAEEYDKILCEDK